MKVLAIDPGYERVGIAVLLKNERGEKEEVCYSSCFRTSADLSFRERLCRIGKEIEDIIDTQKPDCVALEGLFFNSNQKTALRVAEVRGMLLYLAARRALHVYEYTPLQIKIAITGYGRSDKKQIAEMVKRLITVPKPTALDDEFDAIAIGLTCLASV